MDATMSWWWKQRSKNATVEPLQSAAEEAPAPAEVTTKAAPALRAREQRRFREALAAKEPFLILVTGIAGMGKRTLLQTFAEICAAHDPPVCCTGVIDLGRRLTLDELLEEIANGVRARKGDAFAGFNRALKKFRATAAGIKSPAERGLAMARAGVGVAQKLHAPGAGVASVIAESQLPQEALAAASEFFSGRGDLESVKQAFLDDVTELAEKSEPRFVVLLDDFDTLANEQNLRWVREKMLTRLAQAPGRATLVAASVEDAQPVSKFLPPDSPKPELMALQRFSEDETRLYVQEFIRVTKSAVIEQIVRKTGGSPQMLAKFRDHFERYPDQRDCDVLPPSADHWAAQGEARSLLESLGKPLGETVLACAPLRWFNRILLDEVLSACGVKTGQDGATGADLFEDRVHWIRQAGEGWAMEKEDWRCRLVDEQRRLDPARHAQAHQAAARYHFRRLLKLEEAPVPDPIDTDVYIKYTPRLSAEERFQDSDYTAAAAEWLYHWLAIAPRSAFPAITDHVVEAMFDGQYSAATRILNVGPEVPLQKKQRLYLDLLSRAATALQEFDYPKAASIFRELEAAGPPTPLSRAVVAHLLAECAFLTGTERGATGGFRDADILFRAAGDTGRRGIRMRCMNVGWLAYASARRDGAMERGERLVKEAVEDARQIQDSALVGELHRVRGLLLAEVEDFAGAEAAQKEALKCFEGVSPEGAAQTRSDRAQLYLDQDKFDEAEREYEKAATIYRYLEDGRREATVAVGKMGLYLARNRGSEAAGSDEDATWKKLKDEAIQLGGNDPAIYASIGNALSRAGRPKPAAECYRTAAERAPNNAVYRFSLARTLLDAGDYDEAIEEASRAKDLAQDDPDTALLHALCMKRREPGDADRLFEEIVRRRKDQADATAPGAATHADLGKLYFAWERYADAEREYRQAAALEPGEPNGHFQLGRVLYRLGRDREAAPEFLEAIRLAPGRRYLRQPFVLAVRHSPDAATLLQEAVRLCPAEGEFHYQLGMARQRSTPTAEPEVQLQKGGRLEPEQSTKSVPAEAEAQIEASFTEACRLQPANLEYRLALARFYIQSERWDKGQTQVEEARKLDPRNEEVLRAAERIRSGPAYSRVIPPLSDQTRPIIVEVASNLERWVAATPEGNQLIGEMIPALRQMLRDKLGFTIPGIRLWLNEDEDAEGICIYFHEAPRYRYEIRGDTPYLADASGEECAGRAGIEAFDTGRPWDQRPGSWVSEDDLPKLDLAGIPYWDPRGYIVSAIGFALLSNAHEFFGIEELYHVLRENATEVAPGDLSLLASALNRLLRERVPIVNLRAILDEFGASRGQADIVELVERIRRRLAPDFVEPWLESGRVLNAAVVTGEFARQYIHDAIERSGGRRLLRRSAYLHGYAVRALRDPVRRKGVKALVVRDSASRPYVRALLQRDFPDLPVLSMDELLGGIRTIEVFTLDLPKEAAVKGA